MKILVVLIIFSFIWKLIPSDRDRAGLFNGLKGVKEYYLDKIKEIEDVQEKAQSEDLPFKPIEKFVCWSLQIIHWLFYGCVFYVLFAFFNTL